MIKKETAIENSRSRNQAEKPEYGAASLATGAPAPSTCKYTAFSFESGGGTAKSNLYCFFYISSTYFLYIERHWKHYPNLRFLLLATVMRQKLEQKMG